MLLSMYASFRWARKEYYIEKMSILIILVSFLSVLGMSIYALFFGPLNSLSFPAYAVWYERMGPPLPNESSGYWLETYHVVFVNQEVYSIEPVNYVLTQDNWFIAGSIALLFWQWR